MPFLATAIAFPTLLGCNSIIQYNTLPPLRHHSSSPAFIRRQIFLTQLEWLKPIRRCQRFKPTEGLKTICLKKMVLNTPTQHPCLIAEKAAFSRTVGCIHLTVSVARRSDFSQQQEDYVLLSRARLQQPAREWPLAQTGSSPEFKLSLCH